MYGECILHCKHARLSQVSFFEKFPKTLPILALHLGLPQVGSRPQGCSRGEEYTNWRATVSEVFFFFDTTTTGEWDNAIWFAVRFAQIASQASVPLVNISKSASLMGAIISVGFIALPAKATTKSKVPLGPSEPVTTFHSKQILNYLSTRLKIR